MWISFIAGWIMGCVSLYAYMVFTAREPQYEVCMECKELQCGDCHTVDAEIDIRHAA